MAVEELKHGGETSWLGHLPLHLDLPEWSFSYWDVIKLSFIEGMVYSAQKQLTAILTVLFIPESTIETNINRTGGLPGALQVWGAGDSTSVEARWLAGVCGGGGGGGGSASVGGWGGGGALQVWEAGGRGGGSASVGAGWLAGGLCKCGGARPLVYSWILKKLYPPDPPPSVQFSLTHLLQSNSPLASPQPP